MASNSDGSRRQTATSAARWQIASDRSAALVTARVSRMSPTIDSAVGCGASGEDDRLVPGVGQGAHDG